MLNRIRLSNFWTKTRHWEYWPMQVVYAPVFFYWAWSALRARSFFYYAATNPGIENGGMMNESKFRIYQKLREEWYPKTLFFRTGVKVNTVLNLMKNEHLHFPVICKPDTGERGLAVEKIDSEKALKHYLERYKADLLVQEFIDYPEELGIFYYRFPHEQKGRISSVVLKDLLKVTGDGSATIEQLILKSARARLQLEELKKRLGSGLQHIPQKGEVIELMPIGNHCRGTTFLDGNHLINEQLTEVFDQLSQSIDGFYYGRFDLRCRSIEDLYEGRHFKIIELNGTKSEPAHIYHPGYSLRKAYRDIFHHWRVMYKISRLNHRNGTPEQSFREGFRSFREFMRYNPEV